MKSPIQFLLSHIEDFVDDEANEMRERARNFKAETGLEKIEKLTEAHPQDEELSSRVLERLTAFFDAGLLLQKSTTGWGITDVFWKGNTFHLEEKDQMPADHIAVEASPAQIHKTAADPLLRSLNLERLAPSPEAGAFLIRPTPQFAYLLISDLPSPWLPDHMRHAQRLINNSFVY